LNWPAGTDVEQHTFDALSPVHGTVLNTEHVTTQGFGSTDLVGCVETLAGSFFKEIDEGSLEGESILTFLEPRGDSVVPAGWSSGWAFDHGLGHVYASSEASMFTSQLGYGGSGGADGEGGMQSYPNNQKYLLNILHWMDDLLPDPDGGGLYDGRDNCTAIANATQCDSDQDGYGNYCDGDFNQNGTVASNDYGHYFVPDQTAGTDSGTGTDMNCDGVVDAIDYSDYFVPQLGSGYPGPSGYACAGTMPCP
jgi:hypothetical protein